MLLILGQIQWKVLLADLCFEGNFYRETGVMSTINDLCDMLA